MPLQNLNRITQLPLVLHTVAAATTIGYFRWIQGVLDRSYAASGHPVDYATGQTTFDGGAIKEYYAEMQANGTLDVYVSTQLIDFGFIFGMICIALFVCTLIARLGREGSFARKAGVLAGLSVIAGALCDAIENGVSFIMLANPAGFADWLALPYSAFASIKFALITLGMLLVLVSLLSSLVGRTIKRPTIE